MIAKFWPPANVWIRKYINLHMGDSSRVCNEKKPLSTPLEFSNCLARADNSFRSLSLSLLNGGTGGLFWNFIIVCFGFAAVYASLAELGSV
jgi:hypothetical protein